jgi:hypothetical protein
MLSPAFAEQVVPAQSPGFVASVIETVPPAPPATVTVSIATNDAVSVSPPDAAKVHDAPFPAHDDPAHERKRKFVFGVAVRCMVSPGLAWQVFPEHAPGFVESLIETVPPAFDATLTVSITWNDAESVSGPDAWKVQLSPCAEQCPPDHPAKLKPALGVAVSVMLSPVVAVQVSPVHAPGFVLSAIDTEPPAPPVTVIVAVNDAVSVSSPDAVNVQLAPWPAHCPPDQAPKLKPPFGVAVSVMLSPVIAAQVSPVHAIAVVLSAIDTEPPAPATALIVGSAPGAAPRASLPFETAIIRPANAATTIGTPLFTPLGTARTWCGPHSGWFRRRHMVTTA